MTSPAHPHGFLVLAKPAGCTSHDCVAMVRRRLRHRRVGHGGTLDPAVTGVLPLAVGLATRLLPYLPGHKIYEGVVELGVSTDTDDLSGAVLQRVPPPPLSRTELEQALDSFRGVVQQRPPRISAVHLHGERLYVRTRRGEDVLPPLREVVVHRLELLGWRSPRLTIRVHCGAGTYIRSLARDLGVALGCGAALVRLHRLEALGFRHDQAVTMKQLDRHPEPRTLLLDPLPSLATYPRHRLSVAEHGRWRCGRPIPVHGHDNLAQSAEPVVAVLAPDGHLAGMARVQPDGHLQPKLVLDAMG